MQHRWLGLTLFLVLGCGTNGGGDVPSGQTEVTTPDVVEVAEETVLLDALDMDLGDVARQDTVEEPQFPPRKLPFVFTREASGSAPSEAECTTFSRSVTNFFKSADLFRWLLRTSIGVDPSTGMDDFLAWYNDARAVKAGDTVTFEQHGGEHNMWIAGSKVLSSAMNGCVLTGDWTICKVAEQYCKGLTASVKGFVWGPDDPAPFLMARAIFPGDHEFTLDETTWQDDGRKKRVEFSHAYNEEMHWNAQTFAWPENPTWGAIWITNMRSKDDVCAITRTTGFLHYAIADAPYPWVATACQETLDTMVGFNQDIVDSGYNIRTKDPSGEAYVIEDQDLGNYVWYAEVDPLNECPSRLATDLIAYQEPLTNDCGSGTGSLFDMLAPAGHYYNYPIVYDYHMAALLNALVHGHDDVAYNLLVGLAERVDTYLAPNTEEPGATHPNWSRDMAVLLVKAASVGLPLTGDEARLVQQHWSHAVTELSKFPRWDLWAASVPDGEYDGGSGYRPADSPEGIPVESVALLLEYCNSPFKNPAGVAFVDCAVFADIAHWGE